MLYRKPSARKSSVNVLHSEVINNSENIHLRRPRRRWEDNVRMDLKELRFITRDWIDWTQGRGYWRVLVNAALNLQVPQVRVRNKQLIYKMITFCVEGWVFSTVLPSFNLHTYSGLTNQCPVMEKISIDPQLEALSWPVVNRKLRAEHWQREYRHRNAELVHTLE